MFSVDVGSTLEVLTGSTLTINGNLELPVGAVVQGDADTQMNFANGTFVNRGSVLNPGGVATFHNVQIDNTDGVIEAHAVGFTSNVSGTFAIVNGTARGVYRGSDVNELTLRNVTFEDSSTTGSITSFEVFGSTYLEGLIEATELNIGGNSDIYVEGPITFTETAQLQFSYLDAANSDITAANPNGTLVFQGDLMDSANVTIAGESTFDVFEWSLGGVFLNRGYASLSGTVVDGGVIDNSGGVIELSGTSFSFVTVMGGTLITEDIHSSDESTYIDVILSGSGEIQFSGFTILENVTNNAGVIYADEVELRTRFTNNETYEAGGDIFLSDDLTIDGFGEVYLFGGIEGNSAGLTFTLEGQYVDLSSNSGGTSIGGDNLKIVLSNSDLLGDAIDYSLAVIDPIGDISSDTPGFVNRGSIQNVFLTDGYYDNTGGTITDVDLDGARIVGGTLESTDGTEVLGYSVFKDITINGSFLVSGDLELQGNITSTVGTSLSISTANLVINQNTTFNGMTIDIDSDFSDGGIVGTPGATLTIADTSALSIIQLEIGNNTPTFNIEGELYTDAISGSDITQVVPAGTVYSEIAFALNNGTDPTNIDPDATIVLTEDLVFTGLPTLRVLGSLSSDSGFLDISNVVIDNQGTIDAEVMLNSAVINNSNRSISVSNMQDSRIIGGFVDDSYASQLFASGENFLVDADLSITTEISDGSLTILGTTPEVGSGLPTNRAEIVGEIVGQGGELILVGNVLNESFIDTNQSVLTIQAVLEPGGEPSAFTGFVNNGDITMLDGEIYFEGTILSSGGMDFSGTTLNFGPGTITVESDFTSDNEIGLYNTEATFVADPFSFVTASTFVVGGGTLVAHSDWIDSNVPQLDWTSGTVQLSNPSGHTLGSGSTVDTLLGGLTTLINSNRTLSVDETLTLPAGSSLEVVGGKLRAKTIDVAGGTFTFASGELSFDTINANLTNVAGTLAPGQSPGQATIGGDYIQQAAASLQIEIGGTTSGTEYDTVVVQGVATLAGSLEVLFIDDFVAGSGDTFVIMTATGGFGGSAFDTFDISGAPLPDGMNWLVRENGNELLIEAQLPGDFNQDGAVDLADYTLWRNNLGADSGTLPNDPHSVAIGTPQYTTWKTNFGLILPLPESASTATVPEPSTCIMLFALAITLGIRNAVTGSVTAGSQDRRVRS